MTNEAQDDEQFYRDTESVAFAKLDDYQLALLEAVGQRSTVKRGGVVYKAGQRDVGLTVVLKGEIQVVERRDDIEQELVRADLQIFPVAAPGRALGEMPIAPVERAFA